MCAVSVSSPMPVFSVVVQYSVSPVSASVTATRVGMVVEVVAIGLVGVPYHLAA
jgi:hypothetical protein